MKVKNKQVIISEILFKLVNSVFFSGLIYKHLQDGSYVLYKSIGNYDKTLICYFYTISIPIFIKGKLSYQVLLLSYKKIKLS